MSGGAVASCGRTAYGPVTVTSLGAIGDRDSPPPHDHAMVARKRKTRKRNDLDFSDISDSRNKSSLDLRPTANRPAPSQKVNHELRRVQRIEVSRIGQG
jgi:hypothetical protein